MHAMAVPTALKSNTETFVRMRNCLSEKRFPHKGFTKFSEKIDAGASIAELVVLMMAESNDPKNKIWMGMVVCANTIFGSVSCVSFPTCSGYKCFVHKLMNNGSIAMVR